MNLLLFEHKHITIDDMCDALTHMGHTFRLVSTPLIMESDNPEFDTLFDREITAANYDGVFSFNYFPIISKSCMRHNIPYISFVYDNPLVNLYSCTIINPCNHVFLFDSAAYLDFQKENIPTVHYMPLAVNVARLDKMNNTLSKKERDFYTSDLAFVGTMYNEEHNFFDRMKDLTPYTKGYLDGIIEAQLKVFGYYFIEEVLTGDIIADMQKSLPLYPSSDSVATSSWLFAYYVLARKITSIERTRLLKVLSAYFDTKLYTPFPTPDLPDIKNMGMVDYHDMQPHVFKHANINLNITLRSIRSGIPLRCLDIMGAGGFLLSNYQADFYEHFVPGEDLVLFDSYEDCVAKCDYYLKHDAERAQIAANGYGKIKDFHTYETRLQEIFDMVFA